MIGHVESVQSVGDTRKDNLSQPPVQSPQVRRRGLRCVHNIRSRTKISVLLGSLGTLPQTSDHTRDFQGPADDGPLWRNIAD